MRDYGDMAHEWDLSRAVAGNEPDQAHTPGANAPLIPHPRTPGLGKEVLARLRSKPENPTYQQNVRIANDPDASEEERRAAREFLDTASRYKSRGRGRMWGLTTLVAGGAARLRNGSSTSE